MGNRLRMSVVGGVALWVLLACQLPGQASTGQGAETALPESTLTALYRDLEQATAEARAAQTQEALGPSLVAPTSTQTLPAPTPAPVETDGPAPIRSAGAAEAVYLSQPIKLDGVWDEWDAPIYPVTDLIFGNENWDGEDDLSAAYRVGWNEEMLVVAVKVTDDIYAQNNDGKELFNGDSVQVLLDRDLNNDFNNAQLNGDDYQLGISPGNPKPGEHSEAYLWFPRLISGARPQVRVGGEGGDGTYRVEAMIPWSVFNLTPRAGMHLGFALRVADNDEQDKYSQQSLVSGVVGADIGNPTSWGDLVLKPAR